MNLVAPLEVLVAKILMSPRQPRISASLSSWRTVSSRRGLPFRPWVQAHHVQSDQPIFLVHGRRCLFCTPLHSTTSGLSRRMCQLHCSCQEARSLRKHLPDGKVVAGRLDERDLRGRASVRRGRCHRHFLESDVARVRCRRSMLLLSA